MAGRRYSREQWQDWITEQAQSGLSISEFCGGRDVPEASFYHWRKKLAGERKPGGMAGQKSSSLFVPVPIKESAEVEIALPCGAILRVPHDGPALQHVLKALFEVGTTA